NQPARLRFDLGAFEQRLDLRLVRRLEILRHAETLRVHVGPGGLRGGEQRRRQQRGNGNLNAEVAENRRGTQRSLPLRTSAYLCVLCVKRKAHRCQFENSFTTSFHLSCARRINSTVSRIAPLPPGAFVT